nr:hypothetical protein BAR15_110033 [Bartonella sp. AR 15-3]
MFYISINDFIHASTYEADIKRIMEVRSIVLFIEKETTNIYVSMKKNINILLLLLIF